MQVIQETISFIIFQFFIFGIYFFHEKQMVLFTYENWDINLFE